jgi:hypothetical protein
VKVTVTGFVWPTRSDSDPEVEHAVMAPEHDTDVVTMPDPLPALNTEKPG